MDIKEYMNAIVEELAGVVSRISPEAGEKCVDAILAAKRVFVAGAGRSGFAGRAFAMRLMHMGLDAYVVGETITPGIEAGDALIIVSASGETGSLAAMAVKAKAVGAALITVTARPQGTIGKLADAAVSVPAPTPKAKDAGAFQSIQPMGSLFEQSCLVFLDAVILRLMEKRGLGSDEMFARHANLE